MSDLIARLRAAIEQTEWIAEHAITDSYDSHWRERPSGQIGIVADRNHVVATFPIIGPIPHVIRHDPDAVLRRCAADRQILDLREDTARILAAAQAKLLAGAELSHSDTRDLADAGRELCAYDAVLELIAEGYGIELPA